MLATKGLQRAARPVPEREAAHLGDAIAGPRTLHFSLVPPAAAGRSGKPCYTRRESTMRRNDRVVLLAIYSIYGIASYFLYTVV